MFGYSDRMLVAEISRLLEERFDLENETIEMDETEENNNEKEESDFADAWAARIVSQTSSS